MRIGASPCPLVAFVAITTLLIELLPSPAPPLWPAPALIPQASSSGCGVLPLRFSADLAGSAAGNSTKTRAPAAAMAAYCAGEMAVGIVG